MGGRALAFTMFAVLALPLVLAQGASLQAAIDGAEGGVLRLPEGAFDGPARVAAPLSILGVDQRTFLSAPAGAGPILTVGAPNVEARFLRFSAGDVGVHVEDGATALMGPAMFERVGVAIRAAPGATVILRNDPSIPLAIDQAAQARFLFSRLGSLDARDASGAPIAGVESSLLAPDGAIVASSQAQGGFVQLDLPTLERAPDGSTHAVESGWSIRVRAEGYDEQRIPIEQFGQSPMRLTMRATSVAETTPAADEPATSAPQDAPAESPSGGESPASATASAPGESTQTSTPPVDEAPLEATAVETSAETVADAPPMTMKEVAIVAGSAAAVTAAAGGSVLALRSERRLWKLLALFAPLYTRLRKSALLDSPMRAQIRAYVEAHPGVRYRELQRALGLPNGALAHHLQILTREKLVEEVREGQAVRFFVPGARPDAPLDTGERVLAYVRANPGATGVEIAKGLGISVSLAGYHVQKLDEAGRLRREREGVRLKAYATEPL